LPLWVPAMLSGYLTVLVIVLVWKRTALWLVGLVAVSMIWRGEVWKAAFLATEEQVSQSPPLCLQFSPKTKYHGQDQRFLYGDLGLSGLLIKRAAGSAPALRFPDSRGLGTLAGTLLTLHPCTLQNGNDLAAAPRESSKRGHYENILK